MSVSRPWPLALTFQREAAALRIAFDSGEAFTIPYELLRVLSPSAEVRGHRAGQETLVLGKAGVGVREAQPIGRYAVRIIFDDGHDTGLYSWDYLHELGREAHARMAAYRARAAAP
jgi:DUF971 family protein